DAYKSTGLNNLVGATGNGTTMTYTCSGTCQISAGAKVSIKSNSIAGFNVVGATVLTANSSTFTINGAATGSGSGGLYSGENAFGNAIFCVACFNGAINANIHDN